MIRILGILFCLLLPLFSFARTPVSGTLRIENAQYFLVTENNKKFVITQDSTQSALSSLLRLSQGDYIYGQGTFTSAKASLRLTSVDYVGLKKLLGSWSSPTGIFYFKTFTDAAFYTYAKNRPVTANIRYSTAPSQDNSWVVFLSEKETTLLSTIVFEGSEIQMNIYQPDTGEIEQTLRLKRWGH